MIWHSSEYSQVLEQLSVNSETGLSNGEADDRLIEYGNNTITNIEKPSFLKHLCNILKGKLFISLIIFSVISVVLSLVYNESKPYSALLIIAVIVLNALISAYHLFNSDKILNSLRGITNPNTKVLRDGIVQSIPSDSLVPGDIIILNSGDYISADARLLQTTEFRCNESFLTGESVPVEKEPTAVLEDITPIEERNNMVFSGCSVVHGTAKAVVVATGLNTELGRNSAISQQIGDDKLPLKSVLDNSGKIINIVIAVICFIYFLIGIIRNFHTGTFASMTAKVILDTLALGMAAVPESLPAISNVVISLGIYRIIKDNIIIKKTGAVELLGRTSVICADKTGIFTHNSMVLNKVYDGDSIIDLETDNITEKTSLIIKLAAACTTLSNDTTEKAILNACLKHNSMSQIDIENLFPRMDEIPFDPVRKTMTTINMIDGKPCAIVKGAPELLVEHCSDCNTEEILKINNDMAESGMRIICIAMKPLDEVPANPNAEDIERDLIFVGLLGLDSLPRNEAIKGIGICDKSGIRTVMMTGDNPITARAIARRIGVLKDGTELITGAELENMTDDELIADIDKYSVFARISPADKLRIVNAWKKRGEIVAVTGDNVEDAEALSSADIGCAVGKHGTDVARGSADIIITNSSFLSVVSAVKESRGLFENIRKSVFYLLSCNFAELITFIFGLLIFSKNPMTAVQLLCINLLTDCAPAVSLSLEKAEEKVMNKKTSSLSTHVFDYKSLLIGLLSAFCIAIVTLIAFVLGKAYGGVAAVTMAFTTMGITEILHSYNLKITGPAFASIKHLFTSNRFMNISTIFTIFVIMFLVFTPVGFVFGFTILTAKQFFICLALSIVIIPFCEILKIFIRR